MLCVCSRFIFVVTVIYGAAVYGEHLSIITCFPFPDSGLNLLNGFNFYFDIYFEWRDTENRQYSKEY